MLVIAVFLVFCCSMLGLKPKTCIHYINTITIYIYICFVLFFETGSYVTQTYCVIQTVEAASNFPSDCLPSAVMQVRRVRLHPWLASVLNCTLLFAVNQQVFFPVYYLKLFIRYKPCFVYFLTTSNMYVYIVS